MATDNFTFNQRYGSRIEDAEERLLDRKKELKGLSSSFSSNIGQRISPSYPQDSSTGTSQKKDGRSVRSIVAWLELASTNPDTSRHSGDDIKSVHSVGTTSSAGSNSSLFSRQTIPGAADVEEYSLTLLKYKQYFTEVPLGRCLDAQEQDDATISSDVQVKRLSAEARLLQESEDDGPEFDACLTLDHQPFHRNPEEVLAF